MQQLPKKSCVTEVIFACTEKVFGIGPVMQKNQRKIVTIFLSTSFNICFGCSNEPS